MEHLGDWPGLGPGWRSVFLVHRVRDRKDSLVRPLAARFSLVAAMVDPGHSFGRGFALDLSPDQNILADLRHHLSFNDRDDDQKRLDSTGQRSRGSFQGLLRHLVSYVQTGDSSFNHAGVDYGGVGWFHLGCPRYQYGRLIGLREVAHAFSTNAGLRRRRGV